MSESWRERGRLFDAAALDYRTGRPGYPEAVFELLHERCGLRAGARVLEVGAGTGQATMPMLRLGARVTAVEPGDALAKQLAGEAQGFDLQIVPTTFEAAELGEDSFDLVVSATAFHWVDPAIGLAKCAAALRRGGWLALWWNVFGDRERPDEFEEALQPLLLKHAPQIIDDGSAPFHYALDQPARVDEIARTGSFGAVEQVIFRWEGQHTPSEMRRLFATFSPWLALPLHERNHLLDDMEALARERFGGLVVRPYLTVMYLAQAAP